MKLHFIDLILLFLVVTVFAQPPQPSGYYGTLTINGSPAQIGVEVSAWINGINYPTNVVVNTVGQYGILSVNGDDPGTAQKDGGANGEKVDFKVKIGSTYYNASPSSVWETSVNHPVNLSANTGPTAGTIQVNTNLPQATFTINGPATYNGSGTTWSASAAPPGAYTIVYGEIAGYIKPANETKTLIAGGSIIFTGTYSAISSEGTKLVINAKDGTSHAILLHDIIQIKFSGMTEVKDIKMLGGILNSFMLMQNYPNPFNPTTTIEYSIPKTGDVDIRIFNIQGQLVKKYSFQSQDIGVHQITWEGLDDTAQPVASGMYLYQIKFEDKILTKRMLILK